MSAPIPLHLSREALLLGSDRELRRAAARGLLTRVGTGAYLPSDVWNGMDRTERYRARVRATAASFSPSTQFSHDSAAVVWGLPSLGPWSDRVHHVVDPPHSGRSRVGCQRHAVGRDSEAVEREGVRITSLARTLFDVSTVTPFVRAVTMADAALAMSAGADRDRLHDQLEKLIAELTERRGTTRVRRVVDFADGRSGSVGESFARVQFAALGLPAPSLQRSFTDEHGHIGEVDFYWPELDLIGEFDGWSKYGDARRFQQDLTPSEVLRAEKTREDRLRRVARSLCRLTWDVVADRGRLAAHVRPFGLVSAARRRR